MNTRTGKLIHRSSGSVLVGEIEETAQGEGWFIRIIGTENTILYLRRATGWRVTYDPAPLPTEPGWYRSSVYRSENLYRLTTSGEWYEHSASNVWLHTEDEMLPFAPYFAVTLPEQEKESYCA